MPGCTKNVRDPFSTVTVAIFSPSLALSLLSTGLLLLCLLFLVYTFTRQPGRQVRLMNLAERSIRTFFHPDRYISSEIPSVFVRQGFYDFERARLLFGTAPSLVKAIRYASIFESGKLH